MVKWRTKRRVTKIGKPIEYQLLVLTQKLSKEFFLHWEDSKFTLATGRREEKSDEDRRKSQESITWKRDRVSCFDSSDTEGLGDHGGRDGTREMTKWQNQSSSYLDLEFLCPSYF